MGRADASDVKGWCLPTGSWGVLLDGLGGHCIPRVGFWHGGGGDPRYPQGIRWWALSMVERHATRPEALLSSEGCGKRGRVYISASSPGGYCFAIYISFPAASVVLTLDVEPPSNQPRNFVLRDQTRHPVAYRAAHPSIPLVRPVCHPPEFPGPEFRIGVRLARGVTRRDN